MEHLVNKSDPRTVRFVSPAMALRAIECINACVGLPYPATSIKELVEAGEAILECELPKVPDGKLEVGSPLDKLRKALEPFEEKKGEKDDLS